MWVTAAYGKQEFPFLFLNQTGDEKEGKAEYTVKAIRDKEKI